MSGSVAPRVLVNKIKRGLIGAVDITFGFVLSVAFWARPMINNATSFKKESAEVAG